MFSTLSTSVSAPAAPDGSVRDVTLATFKADVLEASKTALVLVDFWATWCEPCKQLTPLLEKLVRASKGAVKLAKIDVDRNQPLAQQMGVQSVPSVFAFFGGRPVDAFAGALPEAQVKAWIEQLLAQTGATGDGEKAGLGTAIKQAAELIAVGDIATARTIYTDILDMEPENAPSHAGLVRCLIEEGNAAEARQMLDRLPVAIAKDKAFEPVRAALELMEQAGQSGGQTVELEAALAQNPADHQARFDLALAHYAAGRREDAVDQLLEIVRRARNWNEDGARKQLVRFFEAFGNSDPLTISARKRLSSIMFS